jgi:hypothetical protein
MNRDLIFRCFGEIGVVNGAVPEGGTVRRAEEMGKVTRMNKERHLTLRCFPSLALASAIGAGQRQSRPGSLDAVGVPFQRRCRDSGSGSQARRGKEANR